MLNFFKNLKINSEKNAAANAAIKASIRKQLEAKIDKKPGRTQDGTAKYFVSLYSAEYGEKDLEIQGAVGAYFKMILKEMGLDPKPFENGCITQNNFWGYKELMYLVNHKIPEELMKHENHYSDVVVSLCVYGCEDRTGKIKFIKGGR